MACLALANSDAEFERQMLLALKMQRVLQSQSLMKALRTCKPLCWLPTKCASATAQWVLMLAGQGACPAAAEA